MKTVTYIFIFLTVILGINIICFIFVDDYRFLLRKIKYPEMSIYINNSQITDEYGLIQPVYSPDIFVEENPKIEDLETEIIPEKEIIEDSVYLEINSEPDTISRLDDRIEIILSAFHMYESHLISDKSIFGLFYDYGEGFEKYGSDSLKIYFFAEGYENIRAYLNSKLENIIDYSINEVNNFGENSFYLNGDSEIVMLIVEYKTGVLGFEIKLSEYQKVKEILLSL